VDILLRRKWIVVLSAVLTFGTACVVTATIPRIYEATATLLVSEPSGTGASASDIPMPSAMAAMAAPNLETHVQLIQARSTAHETAAWLKGNNGPSLSAETIRSSLYARAVPNTQLVQLSARARSPKQAEEIADAAAQSYVAMNRRRARGSSESASQYLSEQLTVAKRNLTEAENALRGFKEATGTVAADAAAGELMNRISSLGEDLDKTRVDLTQARQRLTNVRAQVAQQNRSITAGQVRDNAVVQQLRAKLVDLEGQRLTAQSRYTGSFSDPVEQLDEQIHHLKEQLSGEIGKIVRSDSGDLEMQQALTRQFAQGETEAAALQARYQALQAELRLANQSLQAVPARQIALARIQREVEVAQNIHSDLLKRSQEIEVGRVMALGNTAIAELASAPRQPVIPNVPLNLTLGLVVGLGVGIGLALLQEQWDDTVRDQEEIAQLANAPVLGTVPMFERSDGIPVLLGDAPRSGAIEAYRSLRYSLGFVTPGKGGHTVLVTSTGPSEGKTTTAINLAIAAAASGRRVVLVDGDLRRPTIHRLLRPAGVKGVTDLLVGEAELPEVLQGVEGTDLRFISAGTRAPNPTDLLDSAEMRGLVEQLRREADLVVFDSPPVLSVADTLVLANLSDAVLMVCVPGVPRRRALQQAQLLMAQVGHSISGVVLNKVERKAGYGYYGYHYDYS
jgi:capsular exopolysaccharide synthesis family protein